MSRRLIVREEAEADITEAALWYEEREFGTHFGDSGRHPTRR